MGYRTDNGSDTLMASTITTAGGTPVAIGALTGFNYSTINVLWVDEASNSGVSSDFSGAAASISSFVSGGGRFVYNSRYVTGDAAQLPGGGGVSLVRDFSNAADIDIVTTSTITNGPAGTLNNTSLDGGTYSDHGYANIASLPAGNTVHFIRGGEPTHAVAFSYLSGAGLVYYATIPLDYYLNGSGPNPPRGNFDNIYAPNLIAWACGFAGGTGCATHVHGHTFLFGHGNPTSHGFGHSAAPGNHGHHFTCANHAFGHTPYIGYHLQPDPGEELANPDFVAGLNQDGSTNGAEPAGRGTVVQLFGSAAGLFVGEEDDEQAAANFTPPASGLELYSTTSLPQVRIGGLPAKVLFSGLAPGLTGVWQINVLIPEGTPAGKVPVTVSYEGYNLRSVDITVQ
ncbi:MAG: hypothetical protein HY238_28710 [Acidobacteria bacterium]|nr:hypothetical protein [Acidobacteriota bacterium]